MHYLFAIYLMINVYIFLNKGFMLFGGHRMAQLAEEMSYKPQGRGFDSR
jgi:hypothetical protein